MCIAKTTEFYFTPTPTLIEDLDAIHVQPPYDHDGECSYCGTKEGQQHPADCTWEKLKRAQEARPQDGWISVEKRLPEFAVKVLIVAEYTSGKKLVKLAERQPLNARGKLWNWFDGLWIDPERVTHWMPLPALPITRAENGGQTEGKESK